MRMVSVVMEVTGMPSMVKFSTDFLPDIIRSVDSNNSVRCQAVTLIIIISCHMSLPL